MKYDYLKGLNCCSLCLVWIFCLNAMQIEGTIGIYTLYFMHVCCNLYWLNLYKNLTTFADNMDKEQGPYLPTILENVLCPVLQIFLYLAAFECNTTSDWLTHTG